MSLSQGKLRKKNKTPEEFFKDLEKIGAFVEVDNTLQLLKARGLMIKEKAKQGPCVTRICSGSERVKFPNLYFKNFGLQATCIGDKFICFVPILK